MQIILGGLLSTLFLVLALLAANFAYRLWILDVKAAEKARDRYKNFRGVITGGAKVKTDRLPDGIVRAGMSYNLKEKRIEPNGKLSNDFVDHVAGC